MTMHDYLTAAKKAIAAITNTKAVKTQRTEAFIEPYSLIPMNDLYKLQQVVKVFETFWTIVTFSIKYLWWSRIIIK
jgi:hypothetical protein